MRIPVDEGPILYKKDGTKIRQNGINHGTRVKRSETGLTGFLAEANGLFLFLRFVLGGCDLKTGMVYEFAIMGDIF